MGQSVELKIVAESEDDFDDLCDRAEALAGIIVRVKVGSSRLSAGLVKACSWDDATLVLTLELDADAVRMLELSLNGRETLTAIEGLTRH